MGNDQKNPNNAVPVYLAQAPVATYVPLGYQQITDLSAEVGLTVPEGANFAIIEAEAQNVRWRDDGVPPIAGVGMLLLAGTQMPYSGPLSAIEFIQTTSGAKLNVSYYK